MPLFLENLEKMKCACGADHCSDDIIFQQKCHPEAGTRTLFARGKTHLRIECRKCRKMVVEVEVASSNLRN